MTGLASSLYVGTVSHRRLRPKRHFLRYSLFEMLVDLDELSTLDRQLALFSVGRFNLFSLREKDFGPEGDGPLKDRLRAFLAEQAIDCEEGPIRLMTLPRLLGYAFNPLSIFFCHDRAGHLQAIVYEVHNTFGERHLYALPAAAAADGVIRQKCAKDFYVSPFLGMDMHYDFHLRPPQSEFALSILDSDRDGLVLTATMRLKHRPLTDRALIGLFFTFPLMTLKVIAGIHWEALRLWLKGVRLFARPKPVQAADLHATPAE